MKIRFVGEGVSDIGGNGWVGVVPILTDKVLAAKLGEQPIFEIETKLLPRFHQKRGYPAKAKLAITEAHRQDCAGVAIVVDRDGHRDRLKLLRQGREEAAAEVPISAAVGVAVETMEAWLLADEQAIGKVTGEVVERRQDPESLSGRRGSSNHPKDRLNALLSRDSEENRTNQERLKLIAEETDVSEIEKRCPQGFGPYADEVRHRLAPLFSKGK